MRTLLLLSFLLFVSCNKQEGGYEAPKDENNSNFLREQSPQITLSIKERDYLRGEKLLSIFDDGIFYDDSGKESDVGATNSTVDDEIENISNELQQNISRYVAVLKGTLNVQMDSDGDVDGDVDGGVDVNEQLVELIKITALRKVDYKHLYILIKIMNVIKEKVEFDQANLFEYLFSVF